MALFRRSKARDVTVIFDIGSSSVGGAIVEYSDGGLPVLLFSTRRAIEFKKDLDFEHFFQSMVRALETVSLDVFSSLSHAVGDVAETLADSKKRIIGRRRLGDVVCIFGSPWYQAKIISFREEFENVKLVTAESVVEIARRASDKLKQSFSDPESVRLLENRILDYTLNGYRVEHARPVRARSVEVNIFASGISKETVAATRDPIRKGLGVRKTQAFSFLMAFFSVVRELHPHKSNFVTADVRGEVTEVGIVKDDVLVYTGTFAFGRHSLVRAVAHALSIDLFDAHSRLALYFVGKADEKEAASLEAVLESETSKFASSLQDMLSEFDSLPKTFFLLSDRETEGWFKKVLLETMDSWPGERDITVLNDTYFQKFSDVSKTRYRDHFLVLGALFVKLLRDEKS